MMTENQRIEKFNNLMGKIIKPEFMNYLISLGFFKQPASTQYHGSYEGGLYDHSESVTLQLIRLTKNLNLEWTRPESPYIIGMFHDLCKIDNYKKIVDKIGVQIFGSDEIKNEEFHFEYNEDCLIKGHGDKSIILLSQFMTLTEEEILCIRFHMGAYEGKEMWDAYDKAIRKYENVLWTHTADMYASKIDKGGV